MKTFFSHLSHGISADIRQFYQVWNAVIGDVKLKLLWKLFQGLLQYFFLLGLVDLQNEFRHLFFNFATETLKKIDS